jgi:hypothetical protein
LLLNGQVFEGLEGTSQVEGKSGAATASAATGKTQQRAQRRKEQNSTGPGATEKSTNLESMGSERHKLDL